MRYGKRVGILSIFLLIFFIRAATAETVQAEGKLLRLGVQSSSNVSMPRVDSEGTVLDPRGNLKFASISYRGIPHVQFHTGYISRIGIEHRFFGIDLLVVDAYGTPLEHTSGFLNAAPYVQGGVGISYFSRLTENIGTRAEAHLFLKVGFVKEVFGIDIFSYFTADHFSNGQKILGSDRVPGPNNAEEFFGWGVGFSF